MKKTKEIYTPCLGDVVYHPYGKDYVRVGYISELRIGRGNIINGTETKLIIILDPS